MIAFHKLPLAIAMGCIVGIWIVLFSWVDSDMLRGLMVIMTIYGAARASTSCSCDDEKSVQ